MGEEVLLVEDGEELDKNGSSVHCFICGSRPPTWSRMEGRIGHPLEKYSVRYNAIFDPILEFGYLMRLKIGGIFIIQADKDRSPLTTLII
jgi:hypothetical protein